MNVKIKGNSRLCRILESNDNVYTCEQLDSALPSISHDDEQHCLQHYEKTYKLKTTDTEIDDKFPVKFSKLLRESTEVRDIFNGNTGDRSRSDMRLGHLLWAAGFTKAEAMSTLVNCAKAMSRAPVHRVGYAQNIVDKIWASEAEGILEELSESVEDILGAGDDDETLSGVRFKCHPMVDDTVTGFRLGQVIGIVAGAKVGKTTMALNMFRWFVERNPDYDHIFVSLEQPSREIAKRWKSMCQDDKRLHSHVHIISNYNKDNTFRHLSLADIKEYVLAFSKKSGRKIGTVVIDHIGVLKMKTKDGRRQGIEDVCHDMKPFALETNTMMIMLSQAPREKAGVGDLELDKSAAYGTVFFESYVDLLLVIWQPLKRTYYQGAPTVMAYKFCAIRHKKQGYDKLQEDVRYCAFLDPETDLLREMTDEEHKSLVYFNAKALKMRKEDKKTELIEYVSIRPEGGTDAKFSDSKDSQGTESTTRLLN